MVPSFPQFPGLVEALTETSPEISVRVNQARPGADTLFEDAAVVPWCPQGRYLDNRPAFTFDPAMHQGRYYVQDASSMALHAAIESLELTGPVKYLDVCAAPGGKTTCAMGALPEGSVVVANEYDYKRAEVLAENVAKWGYPRVLVSRGDTKKLAKLAGHFDVVAVDAPCSGEGMMRKDPKAVQQWTPTLVKQCAALQREILDNAWRALRPGGALIYSTCTFNSTENEENLQWLINEYGARPMSMPLLDARADIVSGVDIEAPCYHFLPGRVRGEGLFLAVVRKPGNAVNADSKNSAKNDQRLAPVAKWLTGNNVLVSKGDEAYAIPADAAPFILKCASVLDVLSMGVHAATVKGKDMIPTQELALAQNLADVFVRIDVDYDQAIAYLRREAVVVDAPRGYVLLAYQGHPLGFVKNLGNRSNNLYPKHWRIVGR